MAMPDVLARLEQPVPEILRITKGDSCKRTITLTDSDGAALDLSGLTSLEVEIATGHVNAYTSISAGTAALVGDGSGGQMSIAFTPTQTAAMANYVTWPPNRPTVSDQLVWRLTVSDGTDTITVFLGAVAYTWREV